MVGRMKTVLFTLLGTGIIILVSLPVNVVSMGIMCVDLCTFTVFNLTERSMGMLQQLSNWFKQMDKKAIEKPLLNLQRDSANSRLEALAKQLRGLRAFVDDDRNYYIECVSGNWKKYYSTCGILTGVVYMTEECADEILRMLNSGECVL